jgi:hypothetical protein
MHGYQHHYYRPQPTYDYVGAKASPENGQLHRRVIPSVKNSHQQQSSTHSDQPTRRPWEKVIIHHGGRVSPHGTTQTHQAAAIVAKPNMVPESASLKIQQEQIRQIQQKRVLGAQDSRSSHSQQSNQNQSSNAGANQGMDAPHDMETGHFIVVSGQRIDRTAPYTDGR